MINCIVLGIVNDMMVGILEKNYEVGLILKFGCGIGYEFFILCLWGVYVFGVGVKIFGLFFFMDIFDCICFIVFLVGG